MGTQRGEFGLRARRGHHNGHADLAQDVVGHADHSGPGDRRVRREDFLDLGRVHVVPASDVALVGPAGQLQIALGREPPEVAGRQPPVRCEHGRCGRRVHQLPHGAATSRPRPSSRA